MIHVLSVRYAGGLRLALEFDDESHGTADLSSLVENSQLYAALRDPALFAKAFVEDGAVCWSEDLDVAAERLYALVHQLPEPDSLEQARANERTVRAREQALRADALTQK